MVLTRPGAFPEALTPLTCDPTAAQAYEPVAKLPKSTAFPVVAIVKYSMDGFESIPPNTIPLSPLLGQVPSVNLLDVMSEIFQIPLAWSRLGYNAIYCVSG
jgi:hypothetical protein